MVVAGFDHHMVKADRSFPVVLGEPRFGSKAKTCNVGIGPCSGSCDTGCCNSNCQTKLPGTDAHGLCNGDVGTFSGCVCTFNC